MRKGNKGFTVIELIVSIALLALILVPAAGFFTNSFKFQGMTSMKTATTRAGQHIIENFKNKNYLNFMIDNKTIDAYIQMKGINNLNIGTKIVKDDWGYNNAKYNVDITLTALNQADNSNLNIPAESECCGTVELKSDGSISSSNEDIEVYTKNSDIKDPPFNIAPYKADYPTIILRKEKINLTTGETAKLWIKNLGYGYVDDFGDITKLKDIRVIKDFEEDLNIYIQDTNLGIIEGPKGINVSKDFYKIKSLLLNNEDIEKQKLGEVIFSAEMVITNMSDDTIKDSFNFSFPVDYDYSNESNS